jgi:hypothetical protein
VSGGLRLFIAGRHNPPDPAVYEVVDKLSQGHPYLVRQCASPAALVPTLRLLMARHGGRKIEELDLYDHGGNGHIHLGDPMLFDARVPPPATGTAAAPVAAPPTLTVGADIAREIAPLLTDDARVYLLGCYTAAGDEGRALLLALQALFGKARVVYGSIMPLNLPDFNAHGIIKDFADSALFSSLDAAKSAPPTEAERLVRLHAEAVAAAQPSLPA